MSDGKPVAGEFCWNELATGDTGKAKSFYTDLLNWESTDIPMGEFTYTMFRSGDKEVCGMVQISQEQSGQMPPHWMSYIMVDDLSAVTEKAKALGAQVLVDNKDIGDFGCMSVLVDPTGAQIALWESKQ